MSSQIIKDFLLSFSNEELQYISKLDYGNSADRHFQKLKAVFKNSVIIDFAIEESFYCPYEVIELGKNNLETGHKREYTACMLILMINMLNGGDKMNDIDLLLDYQGENIEKLPSNLKDLVNLMIGQF